MRPVVHLRVSALTFNPVSLQNQYLDILELEKKKQHRQKISENYLIHLLSHPEADVTLTLRLKDNSNNLTQISTIILLKSLNLQITFTNQIMTAIRIRIRALF